jgi:carbonic anhydrase
VADLLTAIRPAVERARRSHPDASDAEVAMHAVHENVWQSIFDLYKQSAEVRDLVREGRVTVVGAVCDISNGKVEWLGEHPWQLELIDALETRSPHGAHADAPHGDH